MPKTFQSRNTQIPGSSYDEVVRHVRRSHNTIAKMTKRQAYVRSSYFRNSGRGEKIFIDLYWEDLAKKNRKIKVERLKLYDAAIDLLRNSRFDSESIFSHANHSLILHRFYGVTRDGIGFCVQVKQDKRSGRLDFMSAFRRTTP